jgi:dTDP-glucose 4,6-dehydratase/GDP-L-fucose synthase
VEARERGDDSIMAWGTGEPTREFLYVKDAAEGILDATEQYNSSNPVNLGSEEEISIQDLVEMIVEETGFEGTIKWDTSKPDGQPRRKLDTSRAKARFGWEATMEIRKGIRETVKWYKENFK